MLLPLDSTVFSISFSNLFYSRHVRHRGPSGYQTAAAQCAANFARWITPSRCPAQIRKSTNSGFRRPWCRRLVSRPGPFLLLDQSVDEAYHYQKVLLGRLQVPFR